MMEELQTYKNEIPEFVIKLYHILEKPQYKDFIAWTNQQTEILIKNPKKLEDKVLPYFFRHKHLSSFIRQLNMYKFNKVNKISKERGWMYFKNEHFQRGNIKEMKFIKRSHAISKKDKRAEVEKQGDSEPNTLKEHSMAQQIAPSRIQMDQKFQDIQNILEGIIKKNPGLEKQLTPALNICYSVFGKQIKTTDSLVALPSMGNLLLGDELDLNCYRDEQNIKNKNMLGNTIRDIPPLHSIILPSLCSLTQFDGL